MQNLLKRLRQRNCLTQQQLADALNIQQSTISRLEKNCNFTSWKVIKKILIYLQASNHDLKLFLLNYNYQKIEPFIELLFNDLNIVKQIEKEPILIFENLKKNLKIKNF